MNDNPKFTVDAVLDRLCRRQRWLVMLSATVFGLLVGSVIAVIAAGVGAAISSAWMHDGIWRVLLLIGTCTILGGAVGWLWPVDRLRMARALDRAASSEDRFASAFQLADHYRRHRVNLIVQDALARVRNVPSDRALPLHIPRFAPLLPLPIVMLAVIFWLAPGEATDAMPPAPEVSAEQWQQLHDEFSKELRELPKPESQDDREIAHRLEDLARMLQENRPKKDVLAEIARLRSDLEKKQQGRFGRNLSMRRAAASMQSSAALKPFANQLRQGQYRKAADALKKLAENLRNRTQPMTAEGFEAAAQDLDRLATELDADAELGHACKNCARAASSMDHNRFADALNRLSQRLRKDGDRLKQCDRLCRSQSALERLEQRLSQCKACSSCKDGHCNKPGCSTCNRFVKNNDKKGGLRAGWGTAEKWKSGTLSASGERRLPSMAAKREQAGRSTSFKVLSADERADSAQSFRDVYAEFVQKSEADLELESAPLAYQDFLRRYFTAIRPTEDAEPAQP